MEWKEVRLGDVVEIVNGFAFKSKAFTLEGIPVIKIKNIKAGKVILKDLDYISTSDINPKYTKIHSSDILITMTGNRMDGSPETWVGKVSLFRHQGDFYLNQRVSALRLIDDSVDNNFLSYYLSSWQTQLYFALNSNSSGGQANITPAVVQEYRLMVPELETQRRIASILSSLDRKIELNNKINAKLEEMAQTIFKNWFVDFEPFKDGKFVENELGMIPEGWRVGTLADIAEITMGQSPAGNSLNENREGMIFYQGSSDFGFRFPSIRVFTTEPKRLAVTNSVLFSVRAPVGDINVAKEECCIGRGVASIKSKYGHDSYLFYTMKSLHKLFDSFDGEGTVFGSINKKTLSTIQILLPSDSIVEQFNNIVSSFDDRIRSLSDESSRLSALRDTLLPKLMSGELEVSE